MNREQLLADLSFDHRGSIVAFMLRQANRFEETEQREAATALRATASSISAEIDISAGKQGIASPMDAIIIEVCRHIEGAQPNAVLARDRSEPATRAYFAAVFVAKRRLGWTNDCIGKHVDRDPSTISAALKRADEIRGEDEAFRELTDELTRREMRCENCRAHLVGTMN